MSKNLYEQPAVKKYISDSDIKNLIIFLIKEKENLKVNDKLWENIKDFRVPVSTPTSEFINELKKNNLLSQLYLLNVNPKDNITIPEVFTYNTHFVFDMEQLADVNSSFKMVLRSNVLENKLITNVTPYVSILRNKINDIQGLHNIVLRDFLCRAYYKSSDNFYISTSASKSISIIYGKMMASLVRRFFDIKFGSEERFINMFFAYYFLNKLIGRDALSVLKTMGKEFYIEFQDIRKLEEILEPLRNKEIDISDICDLIQDLGNIKLQKLNKRFIYEKVNRWSGNSTISSILMVEYPPYFLYLLYQIASNIKSYPYFIAKQLNIVKDINVLIDTINKTSSLYYTIDK